MITITLNLTLSEADAARLWDCYQNGGMCHEDGKSDQRQPLGMELAEWVADMAEATVDSNFQHDANVFARIEISSIKTDTAKHLAYAAKLLRTIQKSKDIGQTLDAQDELTSIKDALGITDIPATTATADTILKAYIGAYRAAKLIK